MWIVRAIKEQKDICLMTSNFSHKRQVAVSDQSVEISQSEITDGWMELIKPIIT